MRDTAVHEFNMNLDLWEVKSMWEPGKTLLIKMKPTPNKVKNDVMKGQVECLLAKDILVSLTLHVSQGLVQYG